jgi:hypothetical protein
MIWKNVVQSVRPYDNTKRRMRFACWIAKPTDTLRNCNSYCLFTATLVERKRLGVAWYVYCLSCPCIEYCYHLESVTVPILLLPVLWNLQLRPWNNLQNIYLHCVFPKRHISSINVITVEHAFLKHEGSVTRGRYYVTTICNKGQGSTSLSSLKYCRNIVWNVEKNYPLFQLRLLISGRNFESKTSRVRSTVQKHSTVMFEFSLRFFTKLETLVLCSANDLYPSYDCCSSNHLAQN